jgi:hypothetical protein
MVGEHCGGCCSVAVVSVGFPGGFWEPSGGAISGRKEGAGSEAFSKSLSRISPSPGSFPHLRSMENTCRAPPSARVVKSWSLPPSEERED